MVNFIKTNFLFFLLPLIYLPSLFNFFSADDWFHLSITQIHSLPEFLNFFSFTHNAQSASFYRPLPTQVFFYIFQSLFGINSFPYYLFVLLSFSFSLYLVFVFAKEILKYRKLAVVSTVIYGVSVSNFTRVYFLSAFQEISLVIFSLLFILSYIKGDKKHYLYLLLALLSKETAVVLPVIALVFDYFYQKINFKKLLPLALIILPYLYLRFVFFGLAQGDSYIWNFSPLKAINTLIWYFLWSIGSPELLVDYIGSGFMPIARFFTDFKNLWILIAVPLLGLHFLIGGATISKLVKDKKLEKNLIFSFLFFVVSLLPVLFLPQHKFALELGLPLVGVSFFLANIFSESKLRYLFLLVYISYNLGMNSLTYTRHYSVGGGIISQNVYQYLQHNYPQYPNGKHFVFINTSNTLTSAWGESKRISQSLSNSDFFRVFYKDKNINVFYQDTATQLPDINSQIKLDSQNFINQ